METKKQTELYRKKCRKLMVDLDLSHGFNAQLAHSLGVNSNQLSMALTGFRKTKRSLEILVSLEQHLLSLKSKGCAKPTLGNSKKQEKLDATKN
jgi:hypothetical protein